MIRGKGSEGRANAGLEDSFSLDQWSGSQFVTSQGSNVGLIVGYFFLASDSPIGVPKQSISID